MTTLLSSLMNILDTHVLNIKDGLELVKRTMLYRASPGLKVFYYPAQVMYH